MDVDTILRILKKYFVRGLIILGGVKGHRVVYGVESHLKVIKSCCDYFFKHFQVEEDYTYMGRTTDLSQASWIDISLEGINTKQSRRTRYPQ